MCQSVEPNRPVRGHDDVDRGQLRNVVLPVTRRRLLQCLSAGGASSLLQGLITTDRSLRSNSAFAQQAGSQQTFREVYSADETDAAVEKAIRFLLTRQQQDGSIQDRKHEVAMTSLAIMALAAVGVQPDLRSRRGIAMSRALDFVLQG
ncbi:MAG: hypothetical protein AAF989_12360, partial [Planctomycetota bacterium]